MDFSRKETGIKDPLGHVLFKERVQAGIGYVQKMLEAKQGHSEQNALPSRWIITGAGSSEAHAQFLAWIINEYTHCSACTRPLSYFIKKPNAQRTGLIVISQGMSPHAEIALYHRNSFEACVLFTAVSTTHPQKGNHLDQLLREGISRIPFYPKDEYGILIRTAGPLTGYAACIQWAQSSLNATIEEVDEKSLFQAMTAAHQQGKGLASPQMLKALKGGCFFLSHAPLSAYLTNLSYKIMEGLFLPPPPIWDVTAFSHGPFQELRKTPRAAFIIRDGSKTYDDVFQLAQTLLKKCTPTYSVLKTELAPPWSIFECEMALNGIVEKALEAWEVDQVNWPGKDEDTPLYTWSKAT